MSTATPESALRTFYRQEFDRVRRDFQASGSGQAAISQRTDLVDRLAVQLWEQYIAPRTHEGCTLAAIGGFGRKALFPHSDVDLLFLCESEAVRSCLKDPVRIVCQGMWDTGLRVSPTTRTIDDCSRFDQDNVEFTISLLDSRFLAGDNKLFTRLREKNLPQLIARESGVLTQRLAEVTRTRHLRFGNTIFHLEPNLKDGPGGLRDAHVSRWLALIEELASQRKWPESLNPQVHSESDGVLDAMEFLSATRCFLHYRAGRDDNSVTWEAQDELSARGIGTKSGMVSSAEWMRLYFRHAKAIDRNTAQFLDHVPSRRSALYQSFQRWRSRISNEEFSVVDGRIYLQQAIGARDPMVVLRLFTSGGSKTRVAA
jgi:[protein-PII] uridylyltransferase